MINKQLLKQFYNTQKVLLHTTENVLCIDVNGVYDISTYLSIVMHGVSHSTLSYYYSVDMCGLLGGTLENLNLFRDYSDTLNQTEVLQKAVSAVERASDFAPLAQLVVLNFGAIPLPYSLFKGLKRLVAKVKERQSLYVLVLANGASRLVAKTDTYIGAHGSEMWVTSPNGLHPIGDSEDNVKLYIAGEVITRALSSIANSSGELLDIGLSEYKELMDKAFETQREFSGSLMKLWE